MEVIHSWRGVAFHAVCPIRSLSAVCGDRAFVGLWGFVVSLLWPYCPNTVGVLSDARWYLGGHSGVRPEIQAGEPAEGRRRVYPRNCAEGFGGFRGGHGGSVVDARMTAGRRCFARRDPAVQVGQCRPQEGAVIQPMRCSIPQINPNWGNSVHHRDSFYLQQKTWISQSGDYQRSRHV